MRKIAIQIFIVIIGIMLSVAGFLGVRKYFYKNYFEKSKYTLAYNNIKDISNSPNIIENNNEVIDENLIINEETTTTTMKTITTIETTTTLKNNTTEEVIIDAPTIKDSSDIVFDGLTIKELTDKLNKNLNSNLTNTGYYFAEYYLKTGLDPYLAVAIVLHETGCKWTCSKLVRECNNVGGMKGNSEKCNGGSYSKYDSLETGINAYLDMLYSSYYSKGLTTPELINPKYAASTTWSSKINNYIEIIKAS